MFTRIGLSIVVSVAFLFAAAGVAGPGAEKQAVDKSSEIRVRLRLIDIEASILLERCEALFKRELALQDSVRACIRSGDARLQEYRQSLEDVKSDLEKTRQRLIALESEKATLSGGHDKEQGEASPRPQGIESGLKAGMNIPGMFHPLIVHHAEVPATAGKRSDFVEEYGARPYLFIFVRTVGEPLTGFLAKLDAEMAKLRQVKEKKGSPAISAAVILCDPNARASEEPLKKLKKLAKQLMLKHVSLALLDSAGPRHWQLNPEADLTVLLIKHHKVEFNHAFRKGELGDTNVKQILADMQKFVEPESDP